MDRLRDDNYQYPSFGILNNKVLICENRTKDGFSPISMTSTNIFTNLKKIIQRKKKFLDTSSLYPSILYNSMDGRVLVMKVMFSIGGYPFVSCTKSFKIGTCLDKYYKKLPKFENQI